MKKKVFASFIVCALVVSSLGIGVFGATNLQDIKAYLNTGLNFKIDGQAWSPKDASNRAIYPITYNNTTYLPVRAAGEALGVNIGYEGTTNTVLLGGGDSVSTATTNHEIATILFPSDKYPETAAHMTAAITNGHEAVCTIDRVGADDNRSHSLSGIPTKPNYDRDEYPMAFCAEGGEGASVAYVLASDNRGAGSWISNAVADYPDGTEVVFAVFGADAKDADVIRVGSVGDEVASNGLTELKYGSCADVRAAGAAPIHKGDAGYSLSLDRDGDGIACE